MDERKHLTETRQSRNVSHTNCSRQTEKWTSVGPWSVAITTDKWLVGRRFEFVDLVRIQGEEGEEDVIRAFIWRLKGRGFHSSTTQHN